MSDVRVVYRKFDGALHWHSSAVRLGEDEYGVWLGQEAGAQWHKGNEGPTTWDFAAVKLVPRGAWWTATFNGAGSVATEIYCDVTSVPVWRGDGEVGMVDLDLDVVRLRDGRVLTLDEDEFAEHRERYAYPADVVEAALASTAWLMEAVQAGAEPFGRSSDAVYRGWLSRVDCRSAS